MTSPGHRYGLTAVLGALCAGCFNPPAFEDIGCGPGGECPPGQECGPGNRCVPFGSVADAAANSPDAPTGGTDASADAGDDARADARWLPDAQPDAMPVDCTGDPDCQTPPDLCLSSGTCNLATNECEFGAVDCSVMNGECTAGICDTDSGDCIAVPASEGSTCGAGPVCGAFGACNYESGTCDTTGTQSRSCTGHVCQSGICTAEPYTETVACTRPSTEGTSCGGQSVAGCGSCGGFNDGFCDEVGSMSCTCTQPTCLSEICTPVAATCSQTCTRNMGGTPCAANSVDDCQPCVFSGDNGDHPNCDESGQSACTCNSWFCGGGACLPQGSSCSLSCTRETTGDWCDCDTCGPDEEFGVDRCCSATDTCTAGCAPASDHGCNEGVCAAL